MAGFLIVDGEYIHQLEGIFEAFEGDFHPEVHGVHHHQLGAGAHALEYGALHVGGEVAQHEEVAVGIGCGQDGVEIGQYVELGFEGVAAIEVGVVAPAPEEGLLVFKDLEAIGIDAVALHHGDIFLGEVATDDGNEVYIWGEIAGCQGDIGGCAADDAVGFAKGRFDGVKSYGAYNEQTHRRNNFF